MEPLAHAKLKEAVEGGESWAVKMYFEYMYGKPKQQVDHTTNGKDFNISVLNLDPIADQGNDSSKED